MGNQLKTFFLLALLTVFLVLIGGALGGRNGMVIALVFAGVMNFATYWYSDKIVLSMYRAKEVSERDKPELYRAVRTLAQRAGLPMPKVYIIPTEAPNAFATGRNPEHAAVAVTEGLLRILNHEELVGVLAHEMGHVNNRDILIGTVAATMAGAITWVATMARWGAFFGGAGRDDGENGGIFGVIALSILAPLAAMLVQMAISRSREYHADATGARFCGNPQALASALQKLKAYAQGSRFQASPATAHMFIVNPLSAGSMARLFSTHPPMEERIARLTGQRPSTPSGPAGRTGSREARGVSEARDSWGRMR